RHLAARAAPDLAAWLERLEDEGKADRTLDDYLRTAAALLREFPDRELRDIDEDSLMRFLRTYPRGSRRVRRAHLNSLFTWASYMGRIDRNPMDRVPRMAAAGQRVPDLFSKDEIGRLCALVAPDGPLMAILLDTGLRKTEARMLERRHVSLERNELTVYRGKGDKDRVIPLTERARYAVRDLDVLEALAPDDHLWPAQIGHSGHVRRHAPIGNGTFHRWYGRCLDSALVPYRNPHTTRHTFATRFLRAGGRLETLRLVMGHASIKTTLDLYGHLDLEDARADLALLEA
ncbi:MAG: tyrosine-type recombinase/integrase, partial [Chloroflexi bacterium]|nr:tyrosine-type recombinase/integrase [Chloroflexota bacterium]